MGLGLHRVFGGNSVRMPLVLADIMGTLMCQVLKIEAIQAYDASTMAKVLKESRKFEQRMDSETTIVNLYRTIAASNDSVCS